MKSTPRGPSARRSRGTSRERKRSASRIEQLCELWQLFGLIQTKRGRVFAAVSFESRSSGTTRRQRRGVDAAVGEYMNGLCSFTYWLGAAGPRKHGAGSDSRYAFHEMCACSSWSTRLRPRKLQSVQ